MFPAMPITGGPYLLAAFICEKLLQEQDGVPSAIRIIDRWNVNGPSENMPTTIIQGTFVITLKSGIYRGNAQVAITPITPSNVRLDPVVVPVLFEGEDDRGVGVVLPIAFPAQEPGLFWFEISLAGQALPPQVITAIPMRVAYLQMVAPRPLPPQTGQQ